MLKGLEVKEVRLSSLNKDLRYEAEYFQNKFNILPILSENIKTEELGRLVTTRIRTGHTPSMKEPAYYGGNIQFIKTDNLRKFRICPPFTDYLSAKGNDAIKNTELRKDDLLVTVIGATHDIIGRCSLVNEEDLPANINQNIAMIRLDKSKVSPSYVCAYLNSKFGQLYLEYVSRQTAQVNLNCEEVGSVPIPLLSDDIMHQVSTLINEAYATDKKSAKLFKTAQSTLAKILSVSEIKEDCKFSNVLTLANTFGASGRLDADYYMPDYERYADLILTYPNGWGLIKDLCEIKDLNFSPEEKQKYKYVELANIGKNGEITGSIEALGYELPTRARRRIATGDVIVSAIEGSLQSCAIVSEEYNNALCSTGFFVVRSQLINSETLLVLFKSVPVQQLMKKVCSGTILASMNYVEFSQLPLPKIELSVQEEIASLVNESFKLRREAVALMDKAISVVEHEISLKLY